ncbi:hypothetical protein H072_7146 [Dactylellina haptotyla CBS 200.50]|uniref:Uncharacterized protein n=1 Tax=Dactylellina haptotyla (strain CBS 200.50) TaxID=1284197 RepID=S8A886_DACHA|nr:hypothetical protein H072_7146 [Dactylellina haptotyla CBS 200.50]
MRVYNSQLVAALAESVLTQRAGPVTEAIEITGGERPSEKARGEAPSRTTLFRLPSVLLSLANAAEDTLIDHRTADTHGREPPTVGIAIVSPLAADPPRLEGPGVADAVDFEVDGCVLDPGAKMIGMRQLAR